MLQDKVKIIVKGKDRTESIRTWKKVGNKITITYSNGKVYSYNNSNISIKRSVLSNDIAFDCFRYLKAIAGVVGLCDPSGKNILLDHYDKIDYVSEGSILAAFLTHKLYNKTQPIAPAIYPFSFNLSQKDSVENALTNTLSIIEGPPGTGKTQTILNIIANAVMRGESVAIVSSNNSATANVLEKLKKHSVDFIAAYLGNLDNKQQFIESQKPLPDLTDWKLLLEEEIEIQESVQKLYISLSEMLEKKNTLSKIQQELDSLELEYKHFCAYCNTNDDLLSLYFKPINPVKSLELWLKCEKYIELGKMPGILKRIFNRVMYGVKSKSFYSLAPDMMIAICQKRYYTSQIAELRTAVLQLQKELDQFNFNIKMDEYSSLSMKLFRNELAKKYKHLNRQQFEMSDLWRNSEEFISEYPIILATTYSLRSSLSTNVMYDYVIVDEASQVDIATGALALSCAKKSVIVGDLKQLPNVVNSDSARNTDIVFAKFDLPEVYRYKSNSLLSTISKMFPTVPRTLLREHYRCHPKIIEFCNQKFYDNQLIIISEAKSKRKPLIVYKTLPGNHAREHVNQRQIDVINNEIIPQQNLDIDISSVGIVSPYRNQTNILQKVFDGTGIKANTVDKFQGRENDVIILSTVDNEISEFTDNANRLNVAVSRAIEQLIVVINGNDNGRDTNIGDLVRYIKYNNWEIIQSEINSVFDYLYKSYRIQRMKLLKNRRISEFESENLMYMLIRNILDNKQYRNFDLAAHVPLRMILRNMQKLDDEEKGYAENILTHVDFLIFDKFGKTPRLAVEVDGVAYHKEGTRQSERDKLKKRIFEKYNLPLMRFKTNGSGERERLTAKLDDIITLVN